MESMIGRLAAVTVAVFSSGLLSNAFLCRSQADNACSSSEKTCAPSHSKTSPQFAALLEVDKLPTIQARYRKQIELWVNRVSPEVRERCRHLLSVMLRAKTPLPTPSEDFEEKINRLLPNKGHKNQAYVKKVREAITEHMKGFREGLSYGFFGFLYFLSTPESVRDIFDGHREDAEEIRKVIFREMERLLGISQQTSEELHTDVKSSKSPVRVKLIDKRKSAQKVR